jgi:hypothetical protein
VRWLSIVTLAGLGSACLPFAVPPARVESGLGARLQDRDAASQHGVSAQAGALRAGFHPTQVMDSPGERKWDVGLGYRAEWRLHEQAPPLHGPYAEFGFYPLRARVGSGTRLRWGSYVSADAVFGEGTKPGPGATFGTLIEVTGSTSGTFSSTDQDSAVAGAAFGQWAFGMFASTSLREVDDSFSQSVITGMSLRVPFAVGVACCFWPSLASNDRSKVASSSSSASTPNSRRSAPKRSYRVARPRRKQ